MFIAVGLQIAIVIVLALGAGLWVDWSSAESLALGGAAAIVPNGLFALRLALHKGRSPESYPVVFFLGEFLKIGLTIGFIGLLAKFHGDLRWLPLLIGLIAALKVTLFALAVSPGTDPGPTGVGTKAGKEGARPATVPASGETSSN